MFGKGLPLSIDETLTFSFRSEFRSESVVAPGGGDSVDPIIALYRGRSPCLTVTVGSRICPDLLPNRTCILDQNF